MLPGCLSSISRYHNRWQVSGLAEVDWKFFTTWLAITYVCDCRKYIVENRIFVGTDIRWILWWLFYFFLSLSQRWEASVLSEGTSSVWSSVLHLCFFFLAIPMILLHWLWFCAPCHRLCGELYRYVLWFEAARSSGLRLMGLSVSAVLAERLKCRRRSGQTKAFVMYRYTLLRTNRTTATYIFNVKR